MSRHTTFRPEMRAAVLSALGAGATYRDAAQAAGIPWRTWCDWTKAHKSGGHNDPDVDALIAEARETYAKATNAITAQVRLASSKDWRAAAFLLQHRTDAVKRSIELEQAKAELELARLKIKAGGVEQHSVTVASVADAAAVAREVFGSASALDNDGPASTASTEAVAVDAVPVSGRVAR